MTVNARMYIRVKPDQEVLGYSRGVDRSRRDVISVYSVLFKGLLLIIVNCECRPWKEREVNSVGMFHSRDCGYCGCCGLVTSQPAGHSKWTTWNTSFAVFLVPTILIKVTG